MALGEFRLFSNVGEKCHLSRGRVQRGQGLLEARLSKPRPTDTRLPGKNKKINKIVTR